TRWPDRKSSREKFRNLKAELWWVTRDRFLKAYEHWLWMQGDGEGKEHKMEDIILLPPAHELRTQLSVVKMMHLANGKMAVETKEQLARRGIPSPDYAESLILTFAPERKPIVIGSIDGIA
ncbi:MAG: hypothetical protein ACXABY_19140, partial [Candidatus Thorarchaeota archaeon]